jgi:hypothetical protein
MLIKVDAEATQQHLDELHAEFSKAYDRNQDAIDANTADKWKLAFDAIKTAAEEESKNDPLFPPDKWLDKFNRLKKTDPFFTRYVRMFISMMRYDPYKDQGEKNESGALKIDARYQLRKCGIYLLKAILKQNYNAEHLFLFSYPFAYAQPTDGWIRHVALFFFDQKQLNWVSLLNKDFLPKNMT